MDSASTLAVPSTAIAAPPWTPVVEACRARQASGADAKLAVTITWAQSLDGCLSAAPGVRTAISDAESMVMTHCLRTVHAAILVGVGTVLADNPRLNARLAPAGLNPQPIILDSSLRFPLSSKLLTDATCVKPLIYTLDAEAGDGADSVAWRHRRAGLLAAGATVVALPVRGTASSTVLTHHVDLEDVFADMLARGYRSMMIEGGARIHAAVLSLMAARARRASCAPSCDVDAVLPVGSAAAAADVPAAAQHVPLSLTAVVTISPRLFFDGTRIPAPDAQPTAAAAHVDIHGGTLSAPAAAADAATAAGSSPAPAARPLWTFTEPSYYPAGTDIVMLATPHVAL